MRPSLEDERRTLLAQIEASRAVYRRLLSGSPGEASGSTSGVTPPGARGRSSTHSPYSRSVQWMTAHPIAVAAGVTLLVWAAPRWWQSRRRDKAGKQREDRMPRYRLPDQRRPAQQNLPTEGIGRALLTAAALLIRNPATVRSLSHAAGTAWQWFQQRRHHRSDNH